MNDITITDEYGYDKDYSYLDEVFSHTLEDQKVKNAIFSVIFVGNEEITLNKVNNTSYYGEIIDVAYTDFKSGFIMVSPDVLTKP